MTPFTDAMFIDFRLIETLKHEVFGKVMQRLPYIYPSEVNKFIWGIDSLTHIPSAIKDVDRVKAVPGICPGMRGLAYRGKVLAVYFMPEYKDSKYFHQLAEYEVIQAGFKPPGLEIADLQDIQNPKLNLERHELYSRVMQHLRPLPHINDFISCLDRNSRRKSDIAGIDILEAPRGGISSYRALVSEDKVLGVYEKIMNGSHHFAMDAVLKSGFKIENETRQRLEKIKAKNIVVHMRRHQKFNAIMKSLPGIDSMLIDSFIASINPESRKKSSISGVDIVRARGAQFSHISGLAIGNQVLVVYKIAEHELSDRRRTQLQKVLRYEGVIR